MSLVWKVKSEAAPLDEVALAAVFRAMSHPKRLRILHLLLTRETCLCGDLVEELELAQSTVSQHLAILREAGLLEVTEDGPRRHYRLVPGSRGRIRAALADW